MTNEEILQRTLNATLERLGKQATTYEVEIANLNAQAIVLNSQIELLAKQLEEKKNKPETVVETKEKK